MGYTPHSTVRFSAYSCPNKQLPSFVTANKESIPMTNKIRNLSSLALLGVLLFPASIALAQSAPDSSTTTTTSTTTSAGTISQFSPDSIVVKTTTSSDPISYSSTKTTTYVDQNGNPVSVETVKSGMPVTVYYTQDGDKMIASKVVVQSTAASSDGSAPSTVETKKTSTTTTSTPAP
jgi:hypothetical protein